MGKGADIRHIVVEPNTFSFISSQTGKQSALVNYCHHYLEEDAALLLQLHFDIPKHNPNTHSISYENRAAGP